MWYQYSILGEWPRERVDSLPDFQGRWHFLFEPQLLVRLEFKYKNPLLITLPHGEVWGDVSKGRTGASGGGPEWPGDEDFYGTDRLCEANLDFLHANSKLVRVLRSEGKNSYKMQRKHVHLLCNQYGMNYWQECHFLARSALRAFWLFLKFGGQ